MSEIKIYAYENARFFLRIFASAVIISHIRIEHDEREKEKLR